MLSDLFVLIKNLRYPTVVLLIFVAFLVLVIEKSFGLSFSHAYGAIPMRFTHTWLYLKEGIFSPEMLWVGATLFTPLFLHGGPEHLLLNMVFLWAFGSLASQHLGKYWVLIIFFVCGACGNLVQVILNPGSVIPIIGASGSVCGFEGVYLGLALRWELPWPDVWPLSRPIPPIQLAMFGVLGFGMDIYSLMNQGQNIAYGAHVGGFLSGLLLSGVITLFRQPVDGSSRASYGTR